MMGLANLVPGVSGGTMLLVVGVYSRFIDAVADVTALRIRGKSLVFLSLVVMGAGLTILFLAGPIKAAVSEYRAVTYSLFIGLTLGSLPLVWMQAKPISRGFFFFAIFFFAFMVLLTFGFEDSASGSTSEGSVLLLFVAGFLGAGSMILPGLSGAYILLLLGQYLPILHGIEQLKSGLFGDQVSGQTDLFSIVEGLGVVGPVCVGVLLGVVAVANVMRWLLVRYRSNVYGVLVGLVVGSVLGLWPFRGEPAYQGEGSSGVRAGYTEAQGAASDGARRYSLRQDEVVSFLVLVGIGATITISLHRLTRSR